MNKSLYLLLIFLCTTALTSTAQYQRIGPKNGAAFSFYKDAGRIWVASNTGIYFSNNNGISWNLSSVPENAFRADDVLCIAANQNDVYAGAKNLGIFHSANAGATWSAVNSGLQTTGGNYSDVEIIGPNALIIRPDSGLLFFTTNQGTTWQKINFLLTNSRAQSLSVFNNTLYVTTNTGLFTSTNNGSSFININPSINGGKLYWANDTAYLATTNGILQSLNFGMSFSPVGLAGRNVTSVAAYGNRIYASVRSASFQDTVKYSTDGGLSFNNAANNNTSFAYRNVHDLVMADSNVLAGTNYGLYYSGTAGSSWAAYDSGFISTKVKGLAASGPLVFAGTSPLGVYKTSDSARSWVHNGDYSHNVAGMIQCIDANGVHVYAGDTSQYYHSGDNGVTWTAGASGLATGNVSSIYAVKSSAEVWVIQNGNLYYSINNGALYTAVPSVGVPAGRAYYISGMDTNLFVAADGGFYHAGSNKIFTLVSGITSPATCVAYSGSAFFAGTVDSGLFTSMDGNTWTHVSPVSPGFLPSKINALAVDSGSMIAGTDTGLFRNITGNWLPDSLQGKIILSLLMNSGHLYVGTCGGVYTQPYPPALPISVPILIRRTDDLEVYPNPATNHFNVGFTAKLAGNAQVIMRDITGHLMFWQSVPVRSGRNDLPIAFSNVNLPAGMYSVQIISGDQKITRQLVIR